MTNDNDNPDNIIPFKPRQLKAPARLYQDEGSAVEEDEVYANVSVREDLVRLFVKDSELFLTPYQAVELCVVLISAMQVAIKFKPKD